jgi:hypothetical protein
VVSGNFLDTGAPSIFAVFVSLDFPTILTPANYAASGTITNAAPINVASGSYFGYFINGIPAFSLGDTPLAAGSHAYSTTGAIDCGLNGGCLSMSSFFGMIGPGDSQLVTASSMFDLEGPGRVPLPATLPLMLAGVTGLAVLARKRTRHAS